MCVSLCLGDPAWGVGAERCVRLGCVGVQGRRGEFEDVVCWKLSAVRGKHQTLRLKG